MILIFCGISFLQEKQKSPEMYALLSTPSMHMRAYGMTSVIPTKADSICNFRASGFSNPARRTWALGLDSILGFEVNRLTNND